jgi:hypothetical protein
MLYAIALHVSGTLSQSAELSFGKTSSTALFNRTSNQRKPEVCEPVKFAERGDVRVYANPYASVLSRFRIGSSPQLAATVSVGADLVGPPVLLVLAARNDTIWDFRTFPKKRLTGVIVLGGSGQAVANLPSAIPVSFNAAVGPNGQCFSASVLESDGSLPRAIIRHLFGNLTYRAIQDRDPATINIDGGRPPRPAPDRLSVRNIRASKGVTRDIPAGIAGMIELLKSGAVRYATQADADAWIATRRRAGLSDKPLGLSSTYVIIRATALPQNGDAFWPTYIVSPGISAPVKAYRYFMLEDGSCKGC